MNEPYEIVIIGAGQAGLSVSYYLTKNNVDHIILDKEKVMASSWRNSKWDSFTFVTPNSMNLLPDYPCREYHDDVFLNKDQVCKYIENFSESFNAPVRLGVNALEISKKTGGMFEIKTHNEVIRSKQVVVATSCFNKPNIPCMASRVSPLVDQIHSSEYKNPDALNDGAILVVGTAQSGAQIIEELVDSGRSVFCATSKVVKTPRRYRGKDITKWARLVGVLDSKSASMLDLNGNFPSSPQLTGKNGGHEIHLQSLMRDGLVLLGRLVDAGDNVLRFSNNLDENMSYADKSCKEWLQRIDKYIDDNDLDVPDPDYSEPEHGDYKNSPDRLSIRDNNIKTIIWATGYKYDYSWIKEDVFDDFNYPITDKGITQSKGLYFVGLPGLDLNKSALMYGIAEHAKGISDHLMMNVDIQAEAS